MSENEFQSREASHLAVTRRFYAQWRGFPRDAVRSGWSDADDMCDAIAADILREGTVRGKPSKAAQAQAAAVKRAGNAIWALRGAVSFGNAPQTASEPPYAPQTGSDARCEPGGSEGAQGALETGARP